MVDVDGTSKKTAIVSKRLHVSGIAPSTTLADLQGRFSSFGTVKAIDGLGARDGNGDLRPFVYVTLEGERERVVKCLNVLSGATWKGSKLRVGEARLDYKERIAKENTQDPSNTTRPAKRRRLLRGTVGVHARDMSVVTPSSVPSTSSSSAFNISSSNNPLSSSSHAAQPRSAWIKTPLGRLVRPMRMRPARPLPPAIPSTTTSAREKLRDGTKEKKERKERKSKKADPPTRARRKLINPLAYGSEYLKGVLLEGTPAVLPGRSLAATKKGEESGVVEEEEGEGEGGMRDAEKDEERMDGNEEGDERATAPLSAPAPTTTTSHPSHSVDPPRYRPSPPSPITEPSYAQEAQQTLRLLGSLFGSANDDDNDESDWGGAESLSDLDVDGAASSRVQVPAGVAGGDGEDFEVVPRTKIALTRASTRAKVVKVAEAAEAEAMMEVDETPSTEPATGQEGKKIEKEKAGSSMTTKALKDMFVPREEDAGFSLLSTLGLDLDLELDDDATAEEMRAQPLVVAPSSDPTASTVTSMPVPQPSSTSAHPIQFNPLSSSSLFFPSSFTSSFTSFSKPSKSKQTPLHEALRAHITTLSAPPFARSQSSEDIRKEWEEKRVELTREWKRRRRGAVKGRGRGVGGVGGE